MDLRNRVDSQLRFEKLSDMIIIEPNLSWWYCQLCRKKGLKPCGVKVCNNCETRYIVKHCKNGHHVQTLDKDRKILNQKRIELDEASKPNKRDESKLIIPPLPTTNNPRKQFNETNNYIQDATATIRSSDKFKQSIFNPNNKFHQNILKVISRLKIDRTLTNEDLRFLNYWNLIHRALKKLESIRQIIDRLESEIEHGANISNHYLSPKDIQCAIKCLSQAQKELDDNVLNLDINKYISMMEDGNSLRGLGARGYMVKAFNEAFELIELFYKLQSTSKSLCLPYQALQTIDTGDDGFEAMKDFVTRDLNRDIKSISSISTDWSGQNAGSKKGARALVKL